MSDDNNSAVPGLSYEDTAASAYRAYAASTGGKNYRGDPMPEFKDLPQSIKIAWECVARHVCNLRDRIIVAPEEMAEMESRWQGYIPPQYR